MIETGLILQAGLFFQGWIPFQYFREDDAENDDAGGGRGCICYGLCQENSFYSDEFWEDDGHRDQKDHFT